MMCMSQCVNKLLQSRIGDMAENEKKYELIINHGIADGFERFELNRPDFIRELCCRIKRPRKIFLGMGDFLEVGDYNNLIDALLLDQEIAKLEGILDKNNRKISQESDIPVSFFKLAVYYPDFLLRDVPVEIISTIGKKARLFPGAEDFIRNIKYLSPLIFTAIPYDISIEYAKRLGLDSSNILATEYKKARVNTREVYTGDIVRFVSGNRRAIAIEKYMAEKDIRDDEIVYVGRGEAGSTTFSTYNSIAFNPPEWIMKRSNTTIYGSSLESLLTLFNFNDELTPLLLSDRFADSMPSLVVLSSVKEKRDELVEIELEHRQLQDNIIGLNMEHSEDSYGTLEREINVMLGASAINITAVRNMIFNRLKGYINEPQLLVRDIYSIAKERYKNLCSA